MGRLQRWIDAYSHVIPGARLDVALAERPHVLPREAASVLGCSVAEVRTFLREGLLVNALDRFFYGIPLDQPLGRFRAAEAHLRLIAPPNVVASSGDVDELLKHVARRDEGWETRWEPFRARLVRDFREELETSE